MNNEEKIFDIVYKVLREYIIHDFNEEEVDADMVMVEILEKYHGLNNSKFFGAKV